MLAKVCLAPGSVKALSCFLSHVAGLSLARESDIAKCVRPGVGQGQRVCRGGVTFPSSHLLSSGHICTYQLFESKVSLISSAFDSKL